MSEVSKLIPKKIKVSFADIDVKFVKDPEFDEDNFGEFCPTDNLIKLSLNATPQDMANTLLHELVHAAVWYGGLRDDGFPLEKEKDEEHVVNVLTNQLCQIMKDNPKILTILAKGLSSQNGRSKKRNKAVAKNKKIHKKYTFHKNRK
jgi:hypothetical protein